MDDLNLSQESINTKKTEIGSPHLIKEDRTLSGLSKKNVYFLKRPLDFLLSALALLVLSPVFLVIALIIKKTSPGPVFYKQERLGVNEKPFVILKFRSMRSDSEETGPKFTKKNDLRITKIGKLIRKTSLDELPQLINIVRGEMSLIGPRPYVGFELADVSKVDRQIRASVRPGISGLSQVSGRSQLSQETTISYDLMYAENCSLKLDLSILFKTIQRVLSCKGTN
ncbi:sugar transferase [Gimesia aquarii]|uniref:UDP-N-acetylgalactosamine-undecaprenyl-phosphate N-acetylgalactosaminephosphotransferase n=1 Tax=Gimesia aquarii TaxID=2527964 RepID=A0A517WWV5_9PLAN|nr:sugar transferase [Gimesia aquarii]QDU09753.1 UDP-N-acetylgalactosamine-undecaprenyl-phosphate N-acetylgalactosaminephosphotransferase [Gimesia aquarii]